jgi:hypothetical protein
VFGCAGGGKLNGRSNCRLSVGFRVPALSQQLGIREVARGTAIAAREVGMRLLVRSAIVTLLLPAALAATAQDPFAWLQPAVTVDRAARSRLDRGEVIVRVLPTNDGEIGVFAAARLDADAETLAAWVNAIARLKKSPYVLMIRRFSDPPVLADLKGLTLDDGDLDAIRDCRPGACELKLAGDDIAALRQAAYTGGPGWKEAVQQEFKRVVLGRLAAYEAGGFVGIAPYADRREPTDPRTAFDALVAHSPYLPSGALSGDPSASFFYWSKEQYGAGKAVIATTQVNIVRPQLPSAVRLAVISREIFATHYRNASLGLAAVTEDAAGQRYLVYVNRSQLDLLTGVFGGWKRSLVEGRLKSESANVFNEVRRRLESGSPPE